MAYRGLISLADVLAIMPGTTESVARFRIKQASDRIQSVISRKLGLRIYPEDAGEILQTYGRDWLEVSHWPIRSIDRVLVDDSPATLEEQAEYYNERGVIVGYASRDSVVRAEYSGGYILPGDADLDYNRSSGPLSIVSSSSSDVGEVTIHGITADGTVIETLNLDGISPVSTDAEWLAGGVWEAFCYDHVGTLTFSVAGQMLGTLAPSKYIIAACDVPGDIQEVAMDIVLGSIARPVKAIQREELPGGAKVQWSTATGERSDISASLSRLKGAYERPAL